MDQTIMPDICKIMVIYSIPSSTCNTADTKAVPDNIAVEQGATSTNRLKIIFIVL
jgi:hypothetical protein